MQLSSKEKRRLEADLLTFLLLACAPSRPFIMDSSSTSTMLNHLIRLIRRFLPRTSNKYCAISYTSRLSTLITALLDCGIPLAIAQRNSRALLAIVPDFDLNSPKYANIKSVLEYHQQEWFNAYLAVRQSKGMAAADAWLCWMEQEEIFFARIASFSPNVAINTLFSSW